MLIAARGPLRAPPASTLLLPSWDVQPLRRGVARGSSVQGGVWEQRAPCSLPWYPLASSNLILSRAHLQLPVSLILGRIGDAAIDHVRICWDLGSTKKTQPINIDSLERKQCLGLCFASHLPGVATAQLQNTETNMNKQQPYSRAANQLRLPPPRTLPLLGKV